MPRKPVLSPGQIREAKDMYAAMSWYPLSAAIRSWNRSE